MDLSALTRKIGPLPIWAWGLIGIAGAFAAYRFLGNRTSDATEPDVLDATGVTPTTAPAGSSANIGLASSGNRQTVTPSIVDNTSPDLYSGSVQEYYDVPADSQTQAITETIVVPEQTYSFGSQTYTDQAQASEAYDQFLVIGGYAPYPGVTAPDPTPAPVMVPDIPHEIDPSTGSYIFDPMTGGFL